MKEIAKGFDHYWVLNNDDRTGCVFRAQKERKGGWRRERERRTTNEECARVEEDGRYFRKGVELLSSSSSLFFLSYIIYSIPFIDHHPLREKPVVGMKSNELWK